MKLYHGTNIDFNEIDISRSHPFKDFGQGFYLTDILSQAEGMASRKAYTYGGNPIIQYYEFDDVHLDDGSLKVRRFEQPSEEWAEFIVNNRSRKYPVFQHPFDVVIGPIADDGVAYLLSRYEEGTYTLEELAKELKYKKLNRQYFFGIYQAIELLKRIK